MKRSPIKIAMAVLAYLAAGAVVNVVVAAGCALWMPLSQSRQWWYIDVPTLAQQRTPTEWQKKKYVITDVSSEGWNVQETLQLESIGIDVFETKGQYVKERTPTRYERAILCRTGLPFRSWEAWSSGEPDPMFPRGSPITTVEMRPVLVLPWSLRPMQPSGRSRYPLIDLRNVTRNVIPLSPVWPGLIANTIVWALILAVLVRGPRWVRGEVRMRRGLCRSCGYPIGVAERCTECGWALPRWMNQVRKPEGAAASAFPSGTSPVQEQAEGRAP